MAARKKKKKRKAKAARLNLLVSRELKEWAHDYAERHDTSVSAIITQHFHELRERELGAQVPQI